jgi:FMN phosphatase YigB (HAD superfamily)
VTFDFWETLFMDTPELDRRRDELRCEGLRENLARLGVKVSIEDLADGFRESTAWLANIWKKGEQMSTLEQIRYIVNHATKNRPILLTDPEALTDGVGFGKPDLRIFLTAAKMLGLEPRSILHVGDNIENDVRGAQRAGMKTLLFEYEVPSGFRTQPSLLALTRGSDSNTVVKPDGRIKSLSEILNFIY